MQKAVTIAAPIMWYFGITNKFNITLKIATKVTLFLSNFSFPLIMSKYPTEPVAELINCPNANITKTVAPSTNSFPKSDKINEGNSIKIIKIEPD